LLLNFALDIYGALQYDENDGPAISGEKMIDKRKLINLFSHSRE